MNQISRSIDQFRHEFLQRFEKVERVEPPIFRRILLFSFLEAIAKALLPSESPRERFVGLMDATDSWTARDLVSVPLLYYDLLDRGRADLSVLLEPHFQEMRTPNIYRVTLESESEIRRDRLPREIGDAARVEVDAAVHKHLLYSFRNFHIHEARTPSGFSLPIDEPFYASMARVEFHSGQSPDVGDEAWELYYPDAFLQVLARNSLAAACQRLQTEQRNPYDSFPDSRTWHRVVRH